MMGKRMARSSSEMLPGKLTLDSENIHSMTMARRHQRESRKKMATFDEAKSVNGPYEERTMLLKVEENFCGVQISWYLMN